MAVFRIPTVKAKLNYKPVLNATEKKVVEVKPKLEADKKTEVVKEEIEDTVYKFGEAVDKSIENILSIQLSNAEGDRANSLQIVFIDENQKLDELLLNRALLAGGIEVPANLFKSPKEDAPESPTGGTGGGVLDVTGGYAIPPDGTKGDALAVAIIKYCKAVGVPDNSHIAAILGNIEIETVMGQYSEEIGGASKSYAPFFGRGLIQITHKSNYERFGAFFGQNFVANPDLVKQLKWAIPIAVGGMTGIRGCPTFTGRKLSDFGSGSNFDFVGARKTVNGTDKAGLVASASRKWLARIPQLSLEPDKASSRIENTYAPGSADSVAQLQAATAQAVSIVPDWAVELSVEIGWSDSDDVFVSSFWYVSRQTSTNIPHTTVLTGRGIRFLINKTKRKSYQNISLRQLVERVGADYGIDTKVPSTPATNQILSYQQNSETDYQFLLRAANAQGFTLDSSFTPPTLTLKAPKDAPKVKIKAEWNCLLSSSETASQERSIGTLPAIDSLVDGESVSEGFSTNLEVNYPTFEVMSLLPGTILELPKGVIPNLPSAYCREYKLKAINVSFSGGTLKVTLDLYIPVNLQSDEEEKAPGTSETKTATGTQGNPQSKGDGTNSAILTKAKTYIGKEYQPTQIDASMSFVRAVLIDANHGKAKAITQSPSDSIPVANSNSFNSLWGLDLGLLIGDISSLNGGEIVHIKNTQGSYPKDTITLVGIASGNGKMIYRPTGQKKIVEVNISTFGSKFMGGIRLTD